MYQLNTNTNTPLPMNTLESILAQMKLVTVTLLLVNTVLSFLIAVPKLLNTTLLTDILVMLLKLPTKVPHVNTSQFTKLQFTMPQPQYTSLFQPTMLKLF